MMITAVWIGIVKKQVDDKQHLLFHWNDHRSERCERKPDRVVRNEVIQLVFDAFLMLWLLLFLLLMDVAGLWMDRPSVIRCHALAWGGRVGIWSNEVQEQSLPNEKFNQPGIPIGAGPKSSLGHSFLPWLTIGPRTRRARSDAMIAHGHLRTVHSLLAVQVKHTRASLFWERDTGPYEDGSWH